MSFLFHENSVVSMMEARNSIGYRIKLLVGPDLDISVHYIIFRDWLSLLVYQEKATIKQYSPECIIIFMSTFQSLCFHQNVLIKLAIFSLAFCE